MSEQAHIKAARTAKAAVSACREIICGFKRWRIEDFCGPNGGESRGVVDLYVWRKSMRQPDGGICKRGDLLDMVFIQVKGGGSAMPTLDDRCRLLEVQRRHGAQIALFGWQDPPHQPASFWFDEPVFSVLTPSLEWQKATAVKLFA